jgi:hypothetical protein
MKRERNSGNETADHGNNGAGHSGTGFNGTETKEQSGGKMEMTIMGTEITG